MQLINNLKQLYFLLSVCTTGKLSKKIIQYIQTRRLKNILISAYKNVPYYKEIIDKAGYNPILNFKGPCDLKLLPILSKKILKERPVTDFIHKSYKESYQSLYFESTSGSTGIPLSIYKTQNEHFIQVAKWLRVLFYNGYTPFDKVISFTSLSRMKFQESFIQKMGLFRRKAISTTLPTDEIVDIVLNYKPDVIYGTKSNIELLCNKIRTPQKKIKFVVIGGEVITAKDKQFYQKN